MKHFYHYSFFFTRALLSLLLVCFSVLSFAQDDTRTPISNIVATSDDIESIPVHSGTIHSPSFTVSEGMPAYIDTSGSGHWMRWDGSNWANVQSYLTFMSGTYKYTVQVRIDGTDGEAYVLAEPVKLTVNGVEWEGGTSVSGGSNFSYTWFTSPEFVIPEPAELFFNSLPSWNISRCYKDEPITPFNVATGAEGGTKPYTFSKTTGPDWINVTADGTVSGTPTTLGSNPDLVIRVTDAAGTWKEVTISIGNTIIEPSMREVVTEVELTSNYDTMPVIGEDILHASMTPTNGAPVYCPESMGGWFQWNGSDWVRAAYGTKFIAGKYQLYQQLRIDGTDGEKYKLGEPLTVKVNGKTWSVSSIAVGDTFSYTWITSEDIEATAPDGIMTIHEESKEGVAIYNLSGQRLDKMQKGINIIEGKKILR